MTFIVNIIIQKIVAVSNFQSQLCSGSITIPQADFCCKFNVYNWCIIGDQMSTLKMRTWDGHGNPYEKSMEGRSVYVRPTEFNVIF